MIGYIVVLAVYVLFVGALVVTDRFAVIYHWAVVPMVLLIWAVFALTTALDPTRAGLLRLGAFTVITGINLFVVPATVDRATFHDVLAYTAGAFVLIALPTVLVGSYGIVGVMISPWHTNLELLGVVLNTPTSVFKNPNHLSGLAAMGAIAAGARYTRSYTPLAAGLVGLNALGAVLAGGRAALLALVVAAGLYVVYRLFGPAAMALLVAVGALAVVVSFGMMFGVVPGPRAITNVDLSGRRALWTAAYEAIRDRPVIGWGPGRDVAVLDNYMESSVNATHNSYLRMFLISGVLGGGAYLALTTIVVVIGFPTVQRETLFGFLLLSVFLTLELFAGMTIFGLSLLSILGALLVGYTQLSTESRQVEFSFR
ncbi:O-antigen ligase family protein [Halococcus sediminicola]|uniref:O-antigen ligase family protein n=1 Tax=Halococcus sediminicola TaxID=1264579 RepID=UPI000ACFA33B|nr:O-antigen ligase family protein [Halococcus sediminicola]